jgi:hypothetical protein
MISNNCILTRYQILTVGVLSEQSIEDMRIKQIDRLQ